MIVDGEEVSGGKPLLVIAGSCPSGLAGMQAMLFLQHAGSVQFWWIKPQAKDHTRLEQATLSLHTTGPHKNVPGKSAGFYKPIQERFMTGTDGEFDYGVGQDGRAFIEEDALGCGHGRQRLRPYFIWQDQWSGAFARQKFLRGKMFYEHAGDHVCKLAGSRFFARSYQLVDSKLRLDSLEEEEFLPSVLPPDSYQDTYVPDH